MIYPWNRSVWERLGLADRPVGGALLLVGPDGVGKGELALSLAQALLCSEPTGMGESCGACRSCRLFSASNHPDYRLLEAGSSDTDGPDVADDGPSRAKEQAPSRWIKVEQVRGLADFLALSSHFGGRKVVVVQGAERLHQSAANALLKTLEEPPPRTHFILVTGRPQRLPATIRSRCVRVPFALPDPATAASWLEAQGLQQPSLALAQAGFSPLKARELDSPDYWSQRKTLIDQVLSGARFDLVVASERASPDYLPLLIGALQRWCYDLLLYKSAAQVRYNPDCAQILHRLAVRVPSHALVRFMQELQSVAGVLEHPLNPRLVMERCLIGYKHVLSVPES